MDKNDCQLCGEYISQYDLYGFNVCVHCFYTKQFEFLSSQLSKYQQKLLDLNNAYKELFEFQEQKSKLSQAYCISCLKKKRNLSKKEIHAIISATQTGDMKRYFTKLISKHLKEKVKS